MAVLVLSALSWAWTMDPDAIRPCLPAGNVHSKDIQVSQKETSRQGQANTERRDRF